MNSKLSANAKQVGLELIDLSDTVAENMQSWSDVLARNPDSDTAKLSAGFITNPSPASALELVIDVQTPPDEPAVLRTWAIETKMGADQREYFNNIQLTFTVDTQEAGRLVAQSNITREDIRILLQRPTSHLARITVSNESGGDSMEQTHGERYDLDISDLEDHEEEAVKIMQTLQTVLPKLKSATN